MSVIGAQLAFGSQIEISDDGDTPVSWTMLEGVQDHSVEMGPAATVNVTHHQSPGGYIEKIAGLRDLADQTFPVLHVPGSATDTLLQDLYNKAAATDPQDPTAIRQIRYSGPGGATPVTFRGYVSNLSYDRPVENAPEVCNVTFTFSSRVTA